MNDNNVINNDKDKIKPLPLENVIIPTDIELDFFNVKLLDNKFINYLFKHKWQCKLCYNIFNSQYLEIQKGKLCENCYGSGYYAKGKYEIIDFIKSLNLNFSCDDTTLLKNDNIDLELKNDTDKLDIVIPEKKIAIVYQNLYWNSEDISNKHKRYHVERTELCKKNGFQLISIYEDELVFKKRIVKSRLRQLLKMNNDVKKVHARNCEIREIPPKLKNDLLLRNHIQGLDNSQIKLGAFCKKSWELIAVMTFSKGSISKGSSNKSGIFELNRFCSDRKFHSPGIAGKLLTYFKRNYKWDEIFSYADRRWSTGNLYYKLGFCLDSVTQPNYCYIHENNILKKRHRYAFRKRPYEPKDITEYQLRLMARFHRIWDSGNYKFVIINK